MLRENETDFIFYEVYKDETALQYHRTTTHFLAWDAFKQRNGATVTKRTIAEYFD